jgi:hypothetical protein
MIRSIRAAMLFLILASCGMEPFRDTDGTSRPDLEASAPSTVAADPAGGRLALVLPNPHFHRNLRDCISWASQAAGTGYSTYRPDTDPTRRLRWS